MSKAKHTLQLTETQGRLILWACEAGLEQHYKFLRHDGWSDKMSKRAIHKARSSDRKFIRAIMLLRGKIAVTAIKKARGE